MAAKLADLFKTSRGKPVEWAGHQVHMMFELPALTGDKELVITFEQPTPARPQALRLRARGGVVELNDQELDDVVLWSDSAPDTVVVRLRPGQANKPMNLRLWNAWRDRAGTMQAWIGNAGMLVDVGNDGVIVLRCSDGFDEPRFDDLVATLALTAPHTLARDPKLS